MRKIFVIFFILGSIEFAFSQIYKYKNINEIDVEIQRYLIEKNEIDTISKNNHPYLLFSFFSKNPKINLEKESCFIIRVGCSICYDYLLFKNKTEFEIVDLNNLNILLQTADYFLKEESHAAFSKYLKKIIEKYEDNKKAKEIRNIKPILRDWNTD